MPKGKHRKSSMYADESAVYAPFMAEEDTLATLPVEIAYPVEEDNILEAVPAAEPAVAEEQERAASIPANETPADYVIDKSEPAVAEEEEAVAVPIEVVALVEEEPPAEKSIWSTKGRLSKNGRKRKGKRFLDEESHAQWTFPAEERSPEEKLPPEEELPPKEEAPPAEELPPVEEEPLDEEEPTAPAELRFTRYSIKEDEPGLGQEAPDMADSLRKSEAKNPDGEPGENTGKPENQTGEAVLICTSCTRMLLIEYDGSCPFSIITSMCPDTEFCSWLLHTTCFSCANKHKYDFGSRDSFGNHCTTAFSAAVLSEEFMKRTLWFSVADRVCRKPMRIVMDTERRSVAYGKIDVLREETTNECRMRGLKAVETLGEKSGRLDILESFVPGGFM